MVVLIHLLYGWQVMFATLFAPLSAVVSRSGVTGDACVQGGKSDLCMREREKKQKREREREHPVAEHVACKGATLWTWAAHLLIRICIHPSLEDADPSRVLSMHPEQPQKRPSYQRRAPPHLKGRFPFLISQCGRRVHCQRCDQDQWQHHC